MPSKGIGSLIASVAPHAGEKVLADAVHGIALRWLYSRNHYCPVNVTVKRRRANTGAALRAILFGADLKSDGPFFGGFPRLTTLGNSSECWQNAVCTTHGVCALDKLFAHRGALCGRLACHGLALHRTLSHHGLRATHLARVLVSVLHLAGQPTPAPDAPNPARQCDQSLPNDP